MSHYPDCSLPRGSSVWACARDSGGDKQDITGQVEYIKGYCDYHGLVLEEFFIDAARSGKLTATKSRKEFLRMIDLAEASPTPLVRGILFWATSRFARSQKISQLYKSILRARGYEIVYVTLNIPDGPVGALVESVHEFADELYLQNLSEDIKRGLRQVVLMKDAGGAYLGLWPSRPPKFFDHVPYDLGMPRNDGSPRMVGRLVPNPDLFERGRKLFEMYAAGYSFRVCVERIPGLLGNYEWGPNYRPPKGMDSQLSKIISNPIYKGEMHRWGEVFENFVPAMVTPELWEAANTRRSYKRPQKGDSWPAGVPHSRVGAARIHLLSGLCYCDTCKTKMIAWSRRIPKEQYSPQRDEDVYKYNYLCRSKRRLSYDSCDTPSIVHWKLDRRVVNHVLTVYSTPGHITNLVDQVNAMLNSASDLDYQIELSASEVTRLNFELNNLIDLARKTNSDRVVSAYTETEAALAKAKSRLEKFISHKRLLKPLIVDDAIVTDILHETFTTLTSENIKAKQAFLATILDRVEVGVNYARITYSFPFTRLVSEWYPVLQLDLPTYTIDLV